MDVHPDEIYTVAVSLEDGSTIYAVAGEAEENNLIALQSSIEEDKKTISLRQAIDESAAAWFLFKFTLTRRSIQQSLIEQKSDITYNLL